MVVDSLNDVAAMMKQLRNSAHVDDYEEDYDMPGKKSPSGAARRGRDRRFCEQRSASCCSGPCNFPCSLNVLTFRALQLSLLPRPCGLLRECPWADFNADGGSG
jgi:hypothetical protein